VIAAGVARVAFAMEDPNPRVRGRGARRLRDAGVTVHEGLLSGAAGELNRGFSRWIVSGRPHVTVKLAISLDGQIAAAGGASRWISGEASRRLVHRMRSEADAVMVGGGTARRDDPLLTARFRGGGSPRRVIVTMRPGAILRNRLFREGSAGVLVACPAGIPRREAERLRSLGARLLPLPAKSGRFRAADLLGALGAEGVTSLLVEGGGKTAGWLAAEGVVDRYVLFVAPLLLGEGVRAISGWACSDPRSGIRLSFRTVRRVGNDVLLIAEPLEGR
jgi:diaminohydroxyphosphoribosylaminopyrimidine deaminase/5-amino-6-(5-phosphoribosylamino)uracil reductase